MLPLVFDIDQPTAKLITSFDSIKQHGFVTEVSLDCDSGKQILSDIEQTFVNQTLKDVWVMEQLHLLHDLEDIQSFMEKKAELIEKGRNGSQLRERLAFVVCYDETLSGVKFNKSQSQSMPETLGQLLEKYDVVESGIGVLMNADVALKYSKEICDMITVRIIVFKILPGRTKLLLKDDQEKNVKGDFESVCLGSIPLPSDTLPHQVIKSSLYMSYGVEKKSSSVPQHCLPFAIAKFRCTKFYEEIDLCNYFEKHSLPQIIHTPRKESSEQLSNSIEALIKSKEFSQPLILPSRNLKLGWCSSDRLLEGELENNRNKSSQEKIVPCYKSDVKQPTSRKLLNLYTNDYSRRKNSENFEGKENSSVPQLQKQMTEFCKTNQTVFSPNKMQREHIENGQKKIELLEKMIGFSEKSSRPPCSNFSPEKILRSVCNSAKKTMPVPMPSMNENQQICQKLGRNSESTTLKKGSDKPKFHGRTLLKGGAVVRPRNIPLELVKKPGMLIVPTDPRKVKVCTKEFDFPLPRFYTHKPIQSSNKPTIQNSKEKNVFNETPSIFEKSNHCDEMKQDKTWQEAFSPNQLNSNNNLQLVDMSLSEGEDENTTVETKVQKLETIYPGVDEPIAMYDNCLIEPSDFKLATFKAAGNSLDGKYEHHSLHIPEYQQSEIHSMGSSGVSNTVKILDTDTPFIDIIGVTSEKSNEIKTETVTGDTCNEQKLSTPDSDINLVLNMSSLEHLSVASPIFLDEKTSKPNITQTRFADSDDQTLPVLNCSHEGTSVPQSDFNTLLKVLSSSNTDINDEATQCSHEDSNYLSTMSNNEIKNSTSGETEMVSASGGDEKHTVNTVSFSPEHYPRCLKGTCVEDKNANISEIPLKNGGSPDGKLAFTDIRQLSQPEEVNMKPNIYDKSSQGKSSEESPKSSSFNLALGYPPPRKKLSDRDAFIHACSSDTSYNTFKRKNSGRGKTNQSSNGIIRETNGKVPFYIQTKRSIAHKPTASVHCNDQESLKELGCHVNETGTSNAGSSIKDTSFIGSFENKESQFLNSMSGSGTLLDNLKVCVEKEIKKIEEENKLLESDLSCASDSRYLKACVNDTVKKYQDVPQNISAEKNVCSRILSPVKRSNSPDDRKRKRHSSTCSSSSKSSDRHRNAERLKEMSTNNQTSEKVYSTSVTEYSYTDSRGFSYNIEETDANAYEDIMDKYYEREPETKKTKSSYMNRRPNYCNNRSPQFSRPACRRDFNAASRYRHFHQ